MAPKAKAKAGLVPGPRAKAKAKGKAIAKPKAKAGGKAKAKAVVRRRVRGPAASERAPGDPPGDLRVAWDSGHSVRGADLSLDQVLRDKNVVVEEALYFHRQCKLAGVVLGASVAEGRMTLRLQPTGTTDEELLKVYGGNPRLELRLVLCATGCNHEEVADDLVHAVRMRRRRTDSAEEPWVDNLEKVVPAEGPDELERLRALAKKLDQKPEDEGGPGAESGPAVKAKEKEKDKKEAKKKKKKEKKTKKKSASSRDTSSEGVRLNGTRPKQASQKTAKLLFQGTGMDPSEKVRARVARLAKRYVRKRGKRSSSGSDSSTASSGEGRLEEEGDSIFQQAAKVRGIAEGFPGALSFQALSQMRTNLMQSLGEEDRSNSTQAVAVQYYRQVLQRKANGAIARELLSLCAVADQLIRARPAQALDIVLQRLKSAESTLNGTHWSVSQRLELLPQEQATLTATAEMKEAQKVALEESKTRYMAAQPDGRVPTSQKGAGKGKNPGKEDTRRGGDNRKGGKGKGPKGDWKKPEEAAAKAS
eukprot:s1259_g3.t1